MSSNAGWISQKPVSFKRLLYSFLEMRSELPWETHNQTGLGSQVTLFFIPEDSFSIEATKQCAKDRRIPIVLAEHNLGHEHFVELRFWIQPNHNLQDDFTSLQLDPLVTTHMLAEQTGEWHKDSYLTEPGFAIQHQIALAACGGFGWTVYESDKKDQLQKTAKKYTGDVNVILANIIEMKNKGVPYPEILNQLDTYLFSIMFVGNGREVEMVGLKRRAFGGSKSILDHLFYAQDTNAVYMARTRKGLIKLTDGKTKIIRVSDNSSVILTLDPS